MENIDEVAVQLAIGSYDTWFIHIYWTDTVKDPPGLKNILDEYLPWYELWTSGGIRIYGTEAQIRLCVNKIKHIENMKYKKGFDFYKEDAPKKYFSVQISAEFLNKTTHIYENVIWS